MVQAFALKAEPTGVCVGKAVDGDPKDMTNKDKVTLQNYGRPYANGKPSGTYYKFAREPGAPNDLKEW